MAVRRGADGRLTVVKLVEAKAHHGPSRARLGQTADGPQMSAGWLRTRVPKLPDGQLSREVTGFLRGQGGPIDRFGEVHDVNLRHGTYTVRDTRLNPMSRPRPVGEILRSVADESPSTASGRWAGRHLAGLKALRQTRMTSWLGESATSRALNRVASDRLANGPAGWGSAARGVGRSLWVVGAALTLADVGNDVYGWQTGALSRQEFVTRTAGNVGGFAGAWAGGWAGARIGDEIGAFGGPAVWLTVPAGGVIGGLVGGIVGYVAGSTLGQTLADGGYELMDEPVRRDTAARLRDTSFPFDR